MKDLDFDELDKAVNSLMSKTQPSSESSNDQPTPTNSSVQSAPASPSVSAPVSVSTPSATSSVTSPSSPVQSTAPSNDRPVAMPTITPQSLSQSLGAPRPTVPAKRSGRFMDLVPSSYASQNQIKSPAPRQGTTLTPLNENVVADAPAVKPAAPSLLQTPSPSSREFSRPPAERSISPVTMSDSATADSSHQDMPDPLDVHAEEVKTTPTSEPTLTPNTALSALTDPVANVDQPTPTSPFLTDAKVDKRPLGASGLGVTNSSPLASPNVSQAAGQALPAELHTELLEIESDNPAKTKIETPTPANTKPEEKPELTPPISIAQQYKQQPRSGDQSHAAVYDTAAQPVTHPEKKKSNILIIVVIALIIVIGGGGVAALFYLGYI